MWRRLKRIVRGELEHARQAVADRLRRLGHDERYDPPASEAASPPSAAGAPAPPEPVRKAFAALELPLTASADDVRHAWKRLMARYHPDRHARDPELERTATELSRRLTDARDRALAWCEARPGAGTATRP
ncbi:MAG: J domain-containing protein [Deltaproteobacteria bacterium]|nr:J domain-containing protein [Deltaproteobacteria bacterium]